MFATLNASTKLPHCGSAGQSSPLGSAPGRMESGREDAQERQDRDRHQAPAGALDRRRARVRATLIGRLRGSAAGSGG